MDRTLLRASLEGAVEMDFARSGGAGGQNVNKVNSKVVARVRLDRLEGLSEAERARALDLLGNRVTTGGELVVSVDEERDQPRNRAIALDRLEALVVAAARLPKVRRPTRPTRGSRERRLATKRGRSETKRGRSASPGED